MKRLISVVYLISVFLPLLFATGCASTQEHELKMAPAAMLPQKMQNAPTRVREAYQFAIANPDALKNVPCYCGCAPIGHTSDYSCYIKEAKADGTYVFDDHALGCSLCVDIAQDVMRMMRDGRAPPEIRASIISVYSRFGPPNQPVP